MVISATAYFCKQSMLLLSLNQSSASVSLPQNLWHCASVNIVFKKKTNLNYETAAVVSDIRHPLTLIIFSVTLYSVIHLLLFKSILAVYLVLLMDALTRELDNSCSFS